MQGLLTASLSRIVHTIGRAAYLAFRIECAQLFYKYYKQDKESIHAVREAVEGNDNSMPNLVSIAHILIRSTVEPVQGT